MPYRSRRIPSDLGLNPLAETRAKIGRIPFDLTISNPTACGLPYPDDLFKDLSDPTALRYEADPRGPLASRTAIAAEYRRWGVEADTERICLTASTSEAYGFLFRLLCDPGDAVLVPTPSYPLFEHLARLDGLGCETYPLEADACWRLDLAAVERAPKGVRAVIVVHPNNPTGSFVHPDDSKALVALCRDRNWALIADEVFLSYPLDGGPGNGSSFAAVSDCLCFTLGGFSKSLGLPQLKLAWIVTSGPETLVGPALQGLEYVTDAYLSVSTPVALAAPQLLMRGGEIRDAIVERCRTNLETIRCLTAEYPEVSVPDVGGGWNVVLRIPALEEDEALCRRLIERHGVAVHPGNFFGFPDAGHLVISLLPPVALFAEGARLMLDTVTETLGEPRREDP